MYKLAPYFLGGILVFMISSCTNPRWIVQDTDAIDPNDFREVSSEEFLKLSNTVTPETPVLRLEALSKNRYEYAKKVLVARYVQDYKIRPVFLVTGLLGAGAAFYLANSDQVTGVDGKFESFTLNAVGGLLSIVSLFNFKPSGDPRPTGEERYLRQTGTNLRTDTTQVSTPLQDSLLIDLSYGNRKVAEKIPVVSTEGLFEFNMGAPLSRLEIKEASPDSVYVEFNYQDSLYVYEFSLDRVLNPFAEVTSPVTELRNTPEESPENILAELVEGSQLQIVDEADEKWFKVLYGISENYVLKSDVTKIWRTSDFNQENTVVAIPRIPFGEVDVESNIPILKETNENGVGFIIANKEYQGTRPVRQYVDRDARLLKEYLVKALGYREERIFELHDVKSVDSVYSTLSRVGSQVTDSTELFVYLSGYGVLEKTDGDFTPSLLNTNTDADSTINLANLFNRLADLPSKHTVILSDIDFQKSAERLSEQESLPALNRSLTELASSVTTEYAHMAILLSSNPDQASHLYQTPGSEDKKHHIFPYFFAKGLQGRITRLSELYQYLQRNISYTARKLHDEPQDPLIFGNREIDFTDR